MVVDESQFEEGKNGCPRCIENGNDNSQDNFTYYGKGYGGHCWACKFTIPSDEHKEDNEYTNVKGKSGMIKQKDIDNLKDNSLSVQQLQDIKDKTVPKLRAKWRGLSPDICEKMGVRWEVDSDGKPKSMWYPTHVIDDGEKLTTGFKIRGLPKSFYTVGYVGRMNQFIGQTDAVEDTLIIVGGEADLLTVIQALETSDKYRKSYNVVSSPLGEATTANFIKLNYDWVNSHKKIVIALDDDEAGNEAFEAVKGVVDNSRLFRANMRHKDANFYLEKGDGDKIANDFYWSPLPVKDWGIAGSSEIWEETKKAAQVEGIELPAFMIGLKKVFPAGIPLGEIVNLASNTSTGKTVIVNELTLDWVMRTKHKMLIVSFEDNLGTYGLKIASRVSGININRIVDIEERLEVLEKYKQDVFKYLYAEDGSDRFNFLKKIPKDTEELKKALLQSIKVNDSKIVLFDPLSSLLHNKSNEQQTDWMLFEEELKRDNGITCINSLHTRKTQSGQKGQSEGADANEEDVKGSGTIIGTGTINIMIRRNKMSTDPIEQNTTIFKVTKNRPYGITMDYACKIYYSPEHHTLFDFDFAQQHNFFVGYDLAKVKDLAAGGQGVMVTAVEDDDMEDVEILSDF